MCYVYDVRVFRMRVCYKLLHIILLLNWIKEKYEFLTFINGL